MSNSKQEAINNFLKEHIPEQLTIDEKALNRQLFVMLFVAGMLFAPLITIQELYYVVMFLIVILGSVWALTPLYKRHRFIKDVKKAYENIFDDETGMVSYDEE